MPDSLRAFGGFAVNRFTLVYVTHDREEALDIGMRVVIMEKGKIERIGAVEEIRNHFQRK